MLDERAPTTAALLRRRELPQRFDLRVDDESGLRCDVAPDLGEPERIDEMRAQGPKPMPAALCDPAFDRNGVAPLRTERRHREPDRSSDRRRSGVVEDQRWRGK